MTVWMRFVGPHFTMQVPSEWMVISSMQFQVMFLSPPLSDGRSFNLILVLQTSPQIPQYHLQEMHTAKSQEQPDFKLVAEGDFVTHSGTSGAHLSFTARYDNDQIILQRHVIFKVQNTLYWFMISIPTDISTELREGVEEIIQTMLTSFTFTEINLETLLAR